MSRSSTLAALVVAPAQQVGALRVCLERAGPSLSRSVRVVAEEESIVEIVACARRAMPSYGVVVVAREEDVEARLALGVDEVLVAPFDESTFVSTVRRAAVRAGVREDCTVEIRTLQHVLSGIAHAAEGSLTALALDVDALRCSAPDLASDDRVALDDCARAVERVSQTIRDARVFAPCDGEWNLEPIAVAQLIDQTVRVLGAILTERAHVERSDIDVLPMIMAPRRPLARILSRVLLHALDALEQTQTTRGLQRIRIAARSDSDKVAIIVEARPGPATTNSQNRIRLPTEKVLAVAREALHTFGGELVAERASDGHLRLAVILPRQHASLPLRGVVSSNEALFGARRRHRVLLVEPDERILRAAARALDDRFDVLLAATGEEAIATLDENRAVDAFVIDASLPDMSASALVDELRRRRQDLAPRVVLVAGESQSKGLPASPDVPVLEKPLRRASLVAVLESLLAAPSRPLDVPNREWN